MEITKVLNRYKLIRPVIIPLIKSFLYFIRVINKAFAFKSGNIVVISLHKLGDSVLTIPAIREIQKFYKKRIIICCYAELITVYKLGLTDVAFCELNHNHFYFNSRIASHRAKKILRSIKPEIIFDLTGAMTSATLILNSRAREIIGINKEQFKSIYDYYSPIRRRPHLMDIYIDAISHNIPKINREEIKKFPKGSLNQKGKILIHPFAGWKAKEWNIRKFIELSERLINKYELCFIFQVDNVTTEIIMEIKKRGIQIVVTQSVDELIKYIKECKLLIGNDSGPIHIANLLGRPTFTIYGPTNPEFPGPIGNHHDYCRKIIKCSPTKEEEFCFTNGGRSGCPSFECMNQLSLEQVFASLSMFLHKIEVKENNILTKKIILPS